MVASAARSSTSLAWTVASTFGVGMGIGVIKVIEVGSGVPPHAATHRIINTHTRANAVLCLIPRVIAGLSAEYNLRQQGLLIEASGVPDSGFAEVNRGRSPVDVYQVSMQAVRLGYVSTEETGGRA